MSVPPRPGPYGPPPYPQQYGPQQYGHQQYGQPYPYDAPYPYPAPPPARRGRAAAIAAVLAAVVAVAVCGTVIAVTLLGGGTEVSREPVATAGANPFMPSIGSDAPVATVANVSGTYRGDTPGLYGGTGDDATCDRSQLRRFLAEHPDKAAGWAGVLGVSSGDIARYVDSLTPVLLRADTAVTNHGWRDGEVTSYPAVLQAGTAVLVDPYGSPVTRCFCGNPLTAPSSFSSVVYVGPSWSSFSTTSISVISSSTTVVNDYTIVDVHTGRGHDRPRGTAGDDDRPVADVASPLDGDSTTGATGDPGSATTDATSSGDTAAATDATGSAGSAGGTDDTTSASPSTTATDSLAGTTWLGSATCAYDGIAGTVIGLGSDETFTMAGTPSGRYTFTGGTLELIAEDSLQGDPPVSFTGSGDTLTASNGCTLTKQ